MLEELKGKKIAIVGLGKNNQKLADYFNTQGVPFEIIQDWQSTDELVGKLDRFDIIFRTPGLPYLSKAITQAKTAGVEISSQTKLFFKLCKGTIIGVTGTKGKGTTSSLITKILETAGKKVWLAGNIGTDPFEFIDQISTQDFVVLELSSFQLQDLDRSPQIGVILSITPDHLNHHADFDEYIHAKSTLIAFQNSTDFAVLHPSLPQWLKDLGQGQKIFIDNSRVSNFKSKLLGQHNLDNIAAAYHVAEILHIPEAIIEKAIAEFQPLPHRLNILRIVNGVTYIDDGFSTNLEPTIAAIAAVSGPIVLVVGGSDKGRDFLNLGQAIKTSGKIKAVVVIGAVTDKILKSLSGFEGQILTGAKTMTEIFSQLKDVVVSGDTVLFSPATASFGLFKNEYDRAEQFVNAVNSL